jgi:hypothetical protein
MPRNADSESLRLTEKPSIAMPTFRVGNDHATAPQRFNKDSMKTTKRLSIEFAHREVTVTIEGSALHGHKSEPDAAHASSLCPVCGSPWITVMAQMDGDSALSTDRICNALEQSGLHLQALSPGQLQICAQSFEQLKEKF